MRDRDEATVEGCYIEWATQKATSNGIGSFYTAGVLYFSILLGYAGDKCAILNQLGGIAT